MWKIAGLKVLGFRFGICCWFGFCCQWLVFVCCFFGVYIFVLVISFWFWLLAMVMVFSSGFG